MLLKNIGIFINRTEKSVFLFHIFTKKTCACKLKLIKKLKKMVRKQTFFDGKSKIRKLIKRRRRRVESEGKS